MQTLTTLDLGENQIGDKGIQQLAEALRTNTVIFVLFFTSPIFSPATFSRRHS